MAGTVLNLFLLSLFIFAVLILVVAPMVVMTIVFWFWKKELAKSIRTRQPRTTYVNGVIRREETA
jgi:flagellar basal body-associated protein FliL